MSPMFIRQQLSRAWRHADHGALEQDVVHVQAAWREFQTTTSPTDHALATVSPGIGFNQVLTYLAEHYLTNCRTM